ncbi:putative dehydrogenase [Sediminihabitans luteus]|uniref:Putative dehydrogenase n=1 Tax=Sediminihabitans luteus TaxID=1138585 RepID=A0A2M9CZP1_9CELL|nr:Gfo/Idh/MocA family oxidoreductase [Sediminihabitans luteus]PJJ77416.1 putative dehydrogenase [Sediminihabitans luteus]GII98309.1 dehydrogenase [Sediminihabitans luteus]
MSAAPGAVPAIAVVGIHGHGAKHVAHVRDLEERGLARLCALVDPRPQVDAPAPATGGAGEPRHGAAATGDDVPWYPTLGDLLSAPEADVRPDVVVLSTPIHTHLPLASTAMRAGVDVLLEKPTTASLAEHAELVAVAQETGRLCQVGFQTFGSHALDVVARAVADGEIGEVTGIGAVGTWVRDAAYWARAPWAGRRRLDGRDVVDGVVTNPLAHAVATALRVAGATRSQDVAEVVVDLHHANDIEADDTSSVRVVTADGTRCGFGLTLCAPERTPARVLVLGTRGRIELEYEHDRIRIVTPTSDLVKTTTRTPLLDDLLAVRAGRARRLACDVRDTGAFMRVMEAVRTAPAPRAIDPDHVSWEGEGDARHPVVDDVAAWCEAVALNARTFTELGAPWAVGAVAPAR